MTDQPASPEQSADDVAAAEERMAAAHENWQHLKSVSDKAWQVYVELRDQWWTAGRAAQEAALNDGTVRP